MSPCDPFLICVFAFLKKVVFFGLCSQCKFHGQNNDLYLFQCPDVVFVQTSCFIFFTKYIFLILCSAQWESGCKNSMLKMFERQKSVFFVQKCFLLFCVSLQILILFLRFKVPQDLIKVKSKVDDDNTFHSKFRLNLFCVEIVNQCFRKTIFDICISFTKPH